MREGIIVEVSEADRSRLEAIVADRNSPQKHVWRARIVLLTADGLGTNDMMRQTGTSKVTVWRWQERFMQAGVAGLLRDKTRPSRIPPLPAKLREHTVALTLGDPPGETTHWTAEMMAKAAGISVSSVQRIWRAHGLQPHRMRQFKLSRDPEFVPKLRDIVGLYVDPPAHAIVLSVDEKSQIQALDRTQPGLPLKPGRCGTMTHDYKRNGTTTLFAALDVLEGKVIGRCMQRHRHQEFIRFLNAIEAETAAGKTRPPHPRQLRQPQAPKGAGLARSASPVRVPLHADIGLLAQCGRGLLRQARPATAQARRVLLARRSPGHDQALPRRDQRQPQALRLDRRPRSDHRRRQARVPNVRFDPLAAGADVTAKDKLGESALHKAAGTDHAEVVAALLAAGADKEAKDNKGGTPLHQAAAAGSLKGITGLLNSGADKDATISENSITPLHLAAVGGQEQAILLLLAAGANKEIRNAQGRTARTSPSGEDMQMSLGRWTRRPKFAAN